MKAVKQFGLLGLILLTTVACRRDYVCECTVQRTSGPVVKTLEVPNSTRNAAEFTCDEYRSTIKELNKNCEIR